jgi:N-acetylglucosamine-6-phosphate deacetylase
MKTTGYVDLQVNGYAGVDFNAESLSLEDIRQACVALRRDGVAMILATVITDEVDVMATRLRRLAQARASDPLVAAVIGGLHLEGPFINPADGYRGAHPATAVRPASIEIAARLHEAGEGLIRLVTLAPECDPGLHVTRYFAEAGVRVAAGHTDASLEILCAACDAGLSLCTHLGNGCPPVLPRHDNIIQRALALRDRLWCCFIADGAHVPFFALRNYLDLTGSARAIIVTDAMAAAGMPPGRFRLGRIKVEVGEDRVARLPGNLQLAGAAVPMALAAANLAREVGLTAEQIHRLTVVNPCAALALLDDAGLPKTKGVRSHDTT